MSEVAKEGSVTYSEFDPHTYESPRRCVVEDCGGVLRFALVEVTIEEDVFVVFVDVDLSGHTCCIY